MEGESQPDEMDAKTAQPMLAALKRLAKQLSRGNTIRLRACVITRLKAALRTVLEQDDHADDFQTAQLLGAMCCAVPNVPLTLDEPLAAEFRAELRDMLAKRT